MFVALLLVNLGTCKSSYKKLLTDNITKTYKQSNNNVYNSTNLEAKHIAKKLEIADRVECMAEKP